MELDDFKKSWQGSPSIGNFNSDSIDEIYIRQIISKSRSAIKKVLLKELIIGSALFIGFLLIVLFLGPKVESYFYKLVAVVFIISFPVYFRLFMSLRRLKKMDYSRDIKTNLTEFLLYNKTTIHLYQWGSLVSAIILLFIFHTDNAFLKQSFQMKILITAFIVVFGFISYFLIGKNYKSKVKAIEDYIKS